MRFLICGAVGLLGLLLAGRAPAAEESAEPGGCEDRVYLLTEARIAELPTIEDRARVWREFLANSPDNPCAPLAREKLAALERSEQMGRSEQQRDQWQQEARGGVVEPDRDELALHQVFWDPEPVNRVRLDSEAVWLAPGFKSHHGEENLALEVQRDALWTLVARGEWAPLAHLAFDLSLPVVVGQLGGQDLDAALGNVALGLRGIWGRRFGEAKHPWVIAGGIVWGTGSSRLMDKAAEPLLDAAAVGAAHLRHLFRYDSPDYALFASTQLGLGAHQLGLGLAYHIYSGGEHVEKILRFDLVWDWLLRDWLALGIELNGGLGDAEAVVGATGDRFVFFVYASPGLRIRSGRTSVSVALRAPLGDAWDWARLITSVEVCVRL